MLRAHEKYRIGPLMKVEYERGGEFNSVTWICAFRMSYGVMFERDTIAKWTR